MVPTNCFDAGWGAITNGVSTERAGNGFSAVCSTTDLKSTSVSQNEFSLIKCQAEQV